MVEHLWKKFYAGSKTARRELIEYYLPMVRAIAKTISYRIPAGAIESDELISSGVLGLVEAIENYNPELGLKFTTYAMPRVRGAILDELRRIDFLPRSARDRVKLYKKKSSELMAKLGRAPFRVEIAKEMKLPIMGLHYYEKANCAPLSIDESFDNDDGRGMKLIELISRLGSNPMKDIERKEKTTQLFSAVNSLSSKEKVIIGLHYIEGVPFKEISHLFSSTESRISQIHTGALKKIRVKLDAVL